MYSEGYGSCRVCLSVCVSGVSVRLENTATYSTGNEGQNICGVLYETALLLRLSASSLGWQYIGSATFPVNNASSPRFAM